jgi:hypothetical protein
VSDLGGTRHPPPGIGEWVSDAEVAAVLGRVPDRVEPLTHNPLNAVTGGIWRVTAGDATAVCKVVTDGAGDRAAPAHWEASADLRHFNYWRREVEAYASDLAAEFRPDGVDAPRLLALDDRGDTAVLWLEDVEGYGAAEWELEELAAFAYALGRAQGRIAAAGGWDRPWLSRGYLRSYSDSKPFDGRRFADDAAWGQPRVASHLDGLREPLERLHRDRERYYELAAACPRTLCHLDVWPANLLRRLVDGSFVLVDWSFCGDGALGEDVANLIPDSVFDLLRPADELDELADLVEESYVEGVGASGWDGDERWVRLGMRAAGVKYHWLVGTLLRDASDSVATAYGGRHVDRDELYAARAAGLRLMCRWAEEAEALAFVLGVPP